MKRLLIVAAALCYAGCVVSTLAFHSMLPAYICLLAFGIIGGSWLLLVMRGTQ